MMKLILVLAIIFAVAFAERVGQQQNRPSEHDYEERLRDWMSHVKRGVQEWFNRNDWYQLTEYWSKKEQAREETAVDANRVVHPPIDKGEELERLVHYILTGEWENVDAKAPGRRQAEEQSAQGERRPTQQEGRPTPPEGLRVVIITAAGNCVYDSLTNLGLVIGGNNQFNSDPEVALAIENRKSGFSSRPEGEVFSYYLARVFFSNNRPNYHFTVRLSLTEEERKNA